MADKFISITRQTATKWLVDGQILDSQTQQSVKFDFSGANAITIDFTNFVAIAARLTTQQQDELAKIIINYFVSVLTPAEN